MFLSQFFFKEYLYVYKYLQSWKYYCGTFLCFAKFSFHHVQVKRSVIISNKQGVYQLPHELPNDLTLILVGFLGARFEVGGGGYGGYGEG